MQSNDEDTSKAFNWTKDTDGIKTIEKILKYNYLDAKTCKPVWIETREQIWRHLVMCGNLWMWAVDLSKKEAAEGQPGGFPTDKTVTIKPYPKESDETCGENDLPRAPGLKQPEVFYRVKAIILAFLPKTSHWYKTLNNQSKDVPVLK